MRVTAHIGITNDQERRARAIMAKHAIDGIKFTALENNGQRVMRINYESQVAKAQTLQFVSSLGKTRLIGASMHS